jgi:hypothetical protein
VWHIQHGDFALNKILRKYWRQTADASCRQQKFSDPVRKETIVFKRFTADFGAFCFFIKKIAIPSTF